MIKKLFDWLYCKRPKFKIGEYVIVEPFKVAGIIKATNVQSRFAWGVENIYLVDFSCGLNSEHMVHWHHESSMTNEFDDSLVPRYGADAYARCGVCYLTDPQNRGALNVSIGDIVDYSETIKFTKDGWISTNRCAVNIGKFRNAEIKQEVKDEI